MTKIVTAADIHLCNDDGYGIYGEGGVNDFLILRYEAANQAVQYAKAHDCILVLAGDLIDSRSADAQTMYYGSRLMREIAQVKFVVIIGGNHDANDRDAFFSMIAHWKHLLPDNVRIVTYPTVCSFEGIDFYCIPAADDFTDYFPSTLSKLMAPHKRNEPDAKIPVSHGPVIGAKWDNNLPSKAGISRDVVDQMDKLFDYIVFGDFHRHQKFCSNGWYTGSIMQSSLRDAGQRKGFQLIDTTSDRVKFVHTNGPVFNRIDIRVESWDGFEFDIDKEQVKGKFVVLNIVSADKRHKAPSNQDIADKLMELGAWRASVDISTETTQTRAKTISNTSGPGEWVQTYVDMNADNLPASRERLIERGLAYMR